MSDTLQTFLREHLYLHIVLIAISVFALLSSMAVDFFAGIHKARQRNEATTSKGFKKTAKKGMKYLMPYMVLVSIDLICSAVLPVPAFSMIWAVYCIFCEFVSVREKAWEKAEMQRAARTMSIVIENKDDIAALVSQLITKTDDTPKNNNQQP